ncbi:MAG: MarR family transcriptional regulator [Leifsonia sp.]
MRTEQADIIVTERSSGSALDDDLNFLLARATAVSLAAGNRALRAYGLKARSYSVLALASTDDPVSQRDVAEFLRLDPSQVVALVDELETRGLVERVSDPRDRRSKVVVATSEGRKIARAATGATRQAEARLHNQFTADQRADLLASLKILAFSS